MSIFKPMTVTCPSCEEAFEIDAAESVNADRRPDLRDAIIDGSFQVMTCPSCGETFRLDPVFNYLDIGRGQWLSVQPLERLTEWIEEEDETIETFEGAFGSGAPASIRDSNPISARSEPTATRSRPTVIPSRITAAVARLLPETNETAVPVS